jgi:hypothetical protein
MTRTCAWCGRDFQAKRSHAKTCSEVCRGRQNTRKRRLAAQGVTEGYLGPAEAPRPAQASIEPISDGVLEMVTETLRQAGRYDTPHGQIAAALASRLDNAHMETGLGIATLSRELERILEKALAGTHTESDELDELQKRRRRKAARAGS